MMFSGEEGKRSCLTVSESSEFRNREAVRSRFRNADRLVDYFVQ